MACWGNRTLNENDPSGERVAYINRYAVLMGYISMAIKGLGFLALTWTTVVLLGGFVSTLHKNDFWSLTFITLVQTAGIFDVALNEKLSYVVRAIFALLEGVFLGVVGKQDGSMLIPRTMLARIVVLGQVLVLAAVLGPLAIIYVFGILVSGGISLWRLIEHGYKVSDGEASNLPPAMDTLYYLALIQCVLFCYRYALSRIGKRLASTGVYLETQMFYRYLRDTIKGCEKDPSFVVGRNLITHAIHMIGSSSTVDCISGVEMLYRSICCMEKELIDMKMKKLLIDTTSYREVVQKLLDMLDSQGQHHDKETRNQAAKIVELLAPNINLEQFPRGIHYISSLIGTLQEYSLAQPSQQGWGSRGEFVQAYKELLLRGLCIIRELASSEQNCRVINDTQDLVSKIVAPVTSNLLNHTSDDHGGWSNIVEASLEVMSRLSGVPGETGAKVRREISSCTEAISTLERIIRCNTCKKELQGKAIQILTHIYMVSTDGSKVVADFLLHKKEFVRMVLDIFTDGNKTQHVRDFAGVALTSFHGGSNATIIIQTSDDVVKRLTGVLLAETDMVFITQAAVILEHLWTYYTEHDGYLSVLKTEMAVAVGKVINKITFVGKHGLANPHKKYCIKTQRCNCQAKGTVSSSSSSCPQNNYHDRKETVVQVNGEIVRHEDGAHTGITKTEIDIENQNDNSFRKGFIPSSYSSHWENIRMRSRLTSPILSLCGMVYDKLVSEGSDLTPQFDNASVFLNVLRMIVVKKGDHTVENLSLLKAVAKMVISMMKHCSDRFVLEREGLQNLIEALCSASKNMLDLDYSMVFTSATRSLTNMKLDKCTLASLVEEAQELYATLPSTS